MTWRGVIAEYRDRLPVTDATPIVTLLEGATPLIPAPRISETVNRDVFLKFVDPFTKKLNDLILEVADELGVDKSDYVRSLILGDLKEGVRRNKIKNE